MNQAALYDGQDSFTVSKSQVAATEKVLDAWGRAKRYTFDIDDYGPLEGPQFRRVGEGTFEIAEGASPPALHLLYQLLYELKLVRREVDKSLDPSILTPSGIQALDENQISGCITRIVRADRFSEGLLEIFANSHILQRLVRAAYALRNHNPDAWPSAFPTLDDGRIQSRMTVRSRSIRLEGRTTGGRQKCRSTSCPGWFIGVLWETGQQMFICSQGWHFDANRNEVFVIGGGEISARYISPPPMGRAPLPSLKGKDREALLSRESWRTDH